jgi:SAM-dependent methyltransferase
MEKTSHRDDRPTAQQILTSLSTSVWAFSTLAAALEAGVLELLTDSRSLGELSRLSGVQPPLIEGMLDLLVAVGLLQRDGDHYRCAPDFLPLLQTSARDYLLADVRITYLQSHQLIEGARRRALAPGWSHTDPDLLRAQGQGSTGAPTVQQWARDLFPHLDGLLERLQQPTARFLDVGTGVAAIALEMCRLFPTLQVVGLEPQAAPLAEARRAVARAGLEQRIELRQQRIEEVSDRGAFDLIWLPQMFLPREVLERGVRAAGAALRPGGWILLLAVSTPGMTLDAALWRLRNVLWGGDPTTPEQVAGLLNTAEFTHVQVFPTAFGSIPRLIVGQRKLEE